jgi:uncharacterized protein (DUF2141 family)
MLAGTLALLLLGTPPPAAVPVPAAPQATLAFAVEGVRNARGQLLVAVYTSSSAWLDLSRAARVLKLPATPGTMYAVMEELPVGPCAVAVFHDENGNGKLDMGWFPLPGPTEGTGASNGATGRLGPPKYDDARLDCRPGETVVRVRLSY